MSRFDSVNGEAAWSIYLHGFAETQGESESDTGYVFANVTRVTLMNIGELELSESFGAIHGDADVFVIARENSQGFVSDELITLDALEAETHWEIIANALDYDDDAADAEL